MLLGFSISVPTLIPVYRRSSCLGLEWGGAIAELLQCTSIQTVWAEGSRAALSSTRLLFSECCSSSGLTGWMTSSRRRHW